ncbi:MAG: Ada metal-binding domain-containing protein [Acidimicrobiales bacterium]
MTPTGDGPAAGARTWRLVGSDGTSFASDRPGTLGGNRRTKVYGRFDCPVARRYITRGTYVANRVFFLDEATAVAAGYRPCASCMPDEHRTWKAAQPSSDRRSV